MPRRYDDELEDAPEEDREISLGATSILGIFFLLTLICAACFGFGYAMRGRQTPAAPVATTPATSPAGDGQAKPSPASAEPASTPETTASTPADSAQTAQTPAAQTEAAPQQPAPALKPVSLARPVAPTPAATKTGVAVVQVAAVSHKQDADLLLQALKKRGYNASIRQTPQDKLLHIQLGPYATKQDATTMRDRLAADGYNAIVK